MKEQFSGRNVKIEQRWQQTYSVSKKHRLSFMARQIIVFLKNWRSMENRQRKGNWTHSSVYLFVISYEIIHVINNSRDLVLAFCIVTIRHIEIHFSLFPFSFFFFFFFGTRVAMRDAVRKHWRFSLDCRYATIFSCDRNKFHCSKWIKSLKKIKITKLNKMKRRFFYYFSIIPRNFIIFNFVFNSMKINDPFRKLADANCRAPDRTDNARWGCTKIIKLSFIFLSPLVYRSYHCYYIYSNN